MGVVKIIQNYTGVVDKDGLTKQRWIGQLMSIYEYNQEEHIKLEREDAFEDGSQKELQKELCVRL